MKPLFFSLLLFLTSWQVTAQFNWMEVLSSPANNSGERFLGVCTGPSGEVFASGTNGPAGNPILQRYDQNGLPGLSRLFTGTGTAYDVEYDRTNSRLVAGGDLNGSPSLQILDPISGATITTSALSGSGLIKALDVTGTHIYAIGNYAGVLNLGSFSITGGSAFVAQFDLNGTPIQAINIRSVAAKGFDVKVDAADNVYFTISTQSDIIFGTGFPGNYSFTSDEEFVLVQANAAFQAQYSQILRRTAFPVTVETEIPLALDEDASLVYVGTPWEPNTTPTVDGGIGSFDLLTGSFRAYVPLPGRTVRDLTVTCGELFAVGGAATAFVRTTCGNAGHAAWVEGYGTTLTPAGLESATFCSWASAIVADDFGALALAGGFKEGTDLTWGAVTSPSLSRGGAMVAKVPTNLNCCTSSPERCLDFDGNNDGILFAPSPLFGQPDFTVDLWFKDEGPTAGNLRTIFFNGGSLFAAGVQSGQLTIHLNGANTQLAPVSNRRWHRLAMTYSGNNLSTYLDGALIDQRTTTISFINLFSVGQYGLTTPANSWQGQLDEVSVYDYAKGPGEILNGLGCSPTGNESGLTLYLPLDQGAPGQANAGVGTVLDQSPSANNGTLQNFALTGQAGNWVCSDLILSACPPDTCGTQPPVNTFSRYREHLDVGSAATDKELDLAYGAFRLPGGQIIQTGVVAGSDVHDPIYIAKTDVKGDPIGNPDLYHPTTGDEAIQLLHDEPTPIRDAAGNLTGFLATSIAELPGGNQQRVLLRFDTSLSLLDSRIYQPVIPGVREWFMDVIQDSNGDYIAVGRIDQTLYNSGFVMRIEPNLNISHYHQFEDSGQDVYPDKIIEGDFNFGGMGGGIGSAYLIGGRTLSGELFVQGLDFNLQPAGNNTLLNLGSSGTGNLPQYVAGLDLLADGRLAVTGTDKSGKIWLTLATGFASGTVVDGYLIDVDNGAEQAYATALLPGDRLLIGGRAESQNSGNEDARALLLEVDLGTVTVNWARTYGNANYPESLVLDVYADDRGILLSGYGITLTGTTAGGFFGDLNHFDSWLAATDTLGRVFDCDCYETTFATVRTATPSINGVALSFSQVNKGQDDQPQDRSKASVVDYFCDQYQAAVVAPACPGGSDEDRDALADQTTVTNVNETWEIANPGLPTGWQITIDWGDGIMESFAAAQLPVSHTYPVDGATYTICILHETVLPDGTVCWQDDSCETIVGTEDEILTANFKVYPNPTSGELFLEYPLNLGAAQAAVFSAGGRMVRKESVQHRRMNLAGLPAGVYVVQLRFASGGTARRRVIVR